MNKAVLIERLSEEVGLTKADAAAAVECVIECMVDALSKEERITLTGFGSWAVSRRQERAGRNPQTGEAIRIKARNSVRFKPGKHLEFLINH
jgi:DNA-binding protein HU-beta